MSSPEAPTAAARSHKLDFFREIKPLSLASLASSSTDEAQSFEPRSFPSIGKSGKRSPAKPDIEAEDSDNTHHSDYEFEMDVGETNNPRSILRQPADPSDQKEASSRGRISWIHADKDEPVASTLLFHRRRGELEDIQARTEAPAALAKSADKPADDPLAIFDNDSDDDTALLIDEGEEEVAGAVVDGGEKKIGKKRMAQIESKKKKMKEEEERNDKARKLALLADKEIKTEEDCEEELSIMNDVAYNGRRKLKENHRFKTTEEIERELKRKVERVTASICPAEMRAIHCREQKSFLAQFGKTIRTELKFTYEEIMATKKKFGIPDDGVNMNDDEEVEDIFNGKRFNFDESFDDGDKKTDEVEEEKEDYEDMSNLGQMFDDNEGMGGAGVDYDSDRRERESDGEEMNGKKKEGKKRRVSTRCVPPKKKKEEDDHPPTEEDVMAEIERKKAVSHEKATRMKRQKVQDKEKKKVEQVKKKQKDMKKREEKKRMKSEGVDEDTLMDRKPKSRAEAARMTKKLLSLGKRRGRRAVDSEEEEGEQPARKKRQYRKRTLPVPFVRKIKEESDGEDGVRCGNYVQNPCDMEDREWFSMEPDEEEEWEEGDTNKILSLPHLWTSDEDKMPAGAIGPRNFDPDEILKRRLNNVQKFSSGLTAEYHDMISELDGMKLNLFADTTLRRFDPRVIHNIDFDSTMRAWPVDLLPKPGVVVPKYQGLFWNGPLTRLVRIRATHKHKDQMTSNSIDDMSGGGAVKITKTDILNNLDDLVESKFRKKENWTPLPSSDNPFDVPEISTRSAMSNEEKEAKDFRSARYKKKLVVANIPFEHTNKKRKKTRLEMLVEEASKPTLTVEEKNKDIYNDDSADGGDEEDAYEYGWDEMGQMMQNGMPDNTIGIDPFAGNHYDGLGFFDEDEVEFLNQPNYDDEERDEEETELGEAFSFMAAHIDL